jgi:hypothetical protein
MDLHLSLVNLEVFSLVILAELDCVAAEVDKCDKEPALSWSCSSSEPEFDSLEFIDRIVWKLEKTPISEGWPISIE